ncbi:MAG: carboxylate-amine ligase [Solirubrobacteraceae bacterium]
MTQGTEAALPDWAQWHRSAPYTVGIEEEVMLLDPHSWDLAHRGEAVLDRLPEPLVGHATPETHEAAIELATAPHGSVEACVREAAALRRAFADAIASLALRAAAAGTHPLAVWSETEVSRGARYQLVYETMRDLARREPTFALHVQVGVPDPDRAIILYRRLRAHLPLLLAISANSPFWQGRDTGLASMRTPIFQGFPRVGIPRSFGSYGAYVEAVDQLLRCGAFPAPTFLWWDVRLQPSLGTVEVRIMDAQATAAESGALAALVQTIAHLELEAGFHHRRLIEAPEVIDENRFLAARDGMEAQLIDPVRERRLPARELLGELLDAGEEHAQELGCVDALSELEALMAENGAARQRRLAATEGLPATIRALSEMFTLPPRY